MTHSTKYYGIAAFVTCVRGVIERLSRSGGGRQKYGYCAFPYPYFCLPPPAMRTAQNHRAAVLVPFQVKVLQADDVTATEAYRVRGI